jgi:2-hydroxy-6-oxonona-2,4-dienedioate hydrolase
MTRDDHNDAPTRLGRRSVHVGGLLVHATYAGPGGPVPSGMRIPIVLVHGFVISSRYMYPTLRRIAHAAECWAPDLPGHGRSETPPRPLDVPGYATALLAWMEAAGIARALLVGNSLGCQIIAHAASRDPVRVAGLVLVGPTVDARARTIRQQAWRLVRDAFRERASLWLLELLDVIRVGPRRMLAMARATVADRIELVLPHVQAPTLVVRGEHDTLVPQAWAEQVARLARAPAPVIVPGAAHGVNYDAPEALAALVLDFARTLESGDALDVGATVTG